MVTLGTSSNCVMKLSSSTAPAPPPEEPPGGRGKVKPGRRLGGAEMERLLEDFS